MPLRVGQEPAYYLRRQNIFKIESLDEALKLIDILRKKPSFDRFLCALKEFPDLRKSTQEYTAWFLGTTREAVNRYYKTETRKAREDATAKNREKRNV